MSRAGRVVLWEQPPAQRMRHRIVSLPVAPEYTARGMWLEALHLIATAQRFAERDAGNRPVSLELVATVQHGSPIPMSYTLHFESTPL